MLGEERIDQADALRFRETIRTEIGEKVLLRLFLLIFIAFVFTVFATHRMVGPIRHMEKNLKACLRGEPSKPIRLRKTDEFQDLAKLINEALLKEEEPEVRSQNPTLLEPSWLRPGLGGQTYTFDKTTRSSGMTASLSRV